MADNAPTSSILDWAKLALGLVGLLGNLVVYLRQKQLIDMAGASLIASALRGQADELAKATKARDDVRAAAARDPASVLRDNDGFRRD